MASTVLNNFVVCPACLVWLVLICLYLWTRFRLGTTNRTLDAVVQQHSTVIPSHCSLSVFTEALII